MDRSGRRLGIPWLCNLPTKCIKVDRRGRWYDFKQPPVPKIKGFVGITFGRTRIELLFITDTGSRTHHGFERIIRPIPIRIWT